MTRAALRSCFVTAFATGTIACAMLSACGDQSATGGLDEPVRVKGAQFVSGPLPGTTPGAAGPPDLRVTSVTSASRVALPGQAGKKLDGRAGGRASAIGLRFADMGSGYWVFPMGPTDPQFPGELSWEAELDFSIVASAAAGFHPLRMVAIDPTGAAGEQSEVALCLTSLTPDNLSSCDPKIAPPDAVISLLWDADMDLDLRVTLPGGRTVDPKHPLTDPTADGGAASPDVGTVSRDSLAACAKDGRRQEDLVFQKRPKGTVDVYAQLFDACGRQATTFTVVVYEADGQPPNRRLVERWRESGRVVSTLAGNDSALPPTFVTSYDFP